MRAQPRARARTRARRPGASLSTGTPPAETVVQRAGELPSSTACELLLGPRSLSTLSFARPQRPDACRAFRANERTRGAQRNDDDVNDASARLRRAAAEAPGLHPSALHRAPAARGTRVSAACSVAQLCNVWPVLGPCPTFIPPSCLIVHAQAHAGTPPRRHPLPALGPRAARRHVNGHLHPRVPGLPPAALHRHARPRPVRVRVQTRRPACTRPLSVHLPCCLCRGAQGRGPALQALRPRVRRACRRLPGPGPGAARPPAARTARPTAPAPPLPRHRALQVRLLLPAFAAAWTSDGARRCQLAAPKEPGGELAVRAGLEAGLCAGGLPWRGGRVRHG